MRFLERQAKRLSKKYKSLKQELTDLVLELKENPFKGISIGKNCYKLRIAIGSKGKGKSGGGRVIINVVISENKVYFLSIFDKSEQENLTDKDLNELLSFIPE